jgi:MinD-like ATPase involved in chromosome partitioning or flagellar assembly/DNA-binding transcriptional ArsR family regulator
MGRDDDIASRILGTLQEKPRSISEIARELDEEKYEISKQIEVLADQGKIDTYRIGQSTACILADDAESPGKAKHTPVSNGNRAADEPGSASPTDRSSRRRPDTGPAERPDPADRDPQRLDAPDEQSSAGGSQSTEDAEYQDVEDWFERALEDDDHAEGRQPESSGPGMEQPEPRATAEDTADAAMQQVPTDAARQTGTGPRTIGIVSGKGGVGKTVVTLNLGAALLDLDEQVIVMDSDAEMPNVGLQLGMYTYPTSLREVVEQDIHIMSAMHVDKDSGLRVIPTALSSEQVQSHVEQAIGMIPDEYIVLIDSPPGYERPIDRVIDTCDELVFVTTPEIPSVTDTYKLAQEAEERGKTVLGAVVNMYSGPKNHLSVAEVEESLEMPVLGVVDRSATVQQSIFDTQPVVSMAPYAKPSQEFKQIAADLVGTSYEPSLVDRVRRFLP